MLITDKIVFAIQKHHKKFDLFEKQVHKKEVDMFVSRMNGKKMPYSFNGEKIHSGKEV